MNQINRPTNTDIILLFVVAVIWGAAFSAIKYVVDDVGAMWVATTRVGIGFLAVLPFFLFRAYLPRDGRTWLLTAGVALLNISVPFILISWAMKHIEAGVTSLLLGTAPIIALVLGHFVTRDERITGPKIFAVILAVSGVVILVGPEAVNGLGSSAVIAQIAVILAAGCYVSAGYLMRRLDLPALTFLAMAMGMGTLMLLVPTLIVAGIPDEFPSYDVLLVLVWLGVFPTGIAYVLRYILVRRVGVSTFSLTMNTVPIFGISIAAFSLSETIEVRTLAALVLVLSGLLIVRYANKDNSAKELK